MTEAATARKYLRGLGFPLHALRGWKIDVAQRAGRDVAVVATKGSEIHFVPLDDRGAMSRRNTLEFLTPIFEEFGFVTTRVPVTETDHRLREVLGFKATWQDEQFTYFAMTALPFQRSTP